MFIINVIYLWLYLIIAFTSIFDVTFSEIHCIKLFQLQVQHLFLLIAVLNDI